MDNEIDEGVTMDTHVVERVKRVHDDSEQLDNEDLVECQTVEDSPVNSPLKKVFRRDARELISNATLLSAINKIGEAQN